MKRLLDYCRISLLEVYMDGITEILLENGALGVFAGFLVYNYFQQMKRLDDLSDKYKGHVDELRKDFKEDVDIVRQRYEKVIERYDKEKDESRLLQEKSFNEISLKLDNLLSKDKTNP
ncbi:MAG: hypothetical protein ACR2M6_02740 [Vampirovibrionia bacterium]